MKIYVLDTTSRTSEDEQMVFYYQMIYLPETDSTIKHDSCYGFFYMTIIIQCTMTLTLCINMAWCCDEPAS